MKIGNEGDICECGHKYENHDDDGMCEVFINAFMGDCPCMRFCKIY